MNLAAVSRRLFHALKRPSILRSPLVSPEIPDRVEYIGRQKRRATLLYGWGFAGTGALGCKTEGRNTVLIPMRLRAASLRDPLMIACGAGYTLVVDSQSRIFLLGINHQFAIDQKGEPSFVTPKRLPVPINEHWGRRIKVTGISAGSRHFLVACVDELCGIYKVLGMGKGGPFCQLDAIMRDRDNSEPIVTCGSDTSFVLFPESGCLYSFGKNEDCQLGYRDEPGVMAPRRITGDLEGRKIIKVSTKSNFAIALDIEGDVFFWGSKEYAHFAVDDKSFCGSVATPIRIKQIPPAKDVAATYDSCAVLTKDNRLLTWGMHNPLIREISIPAEVIDIQELIGGYNCFAFIDGSRQCYAWGKDVRGCLAPTGMCHRVGKRHKPAELLVPTRLSFPADKVVSVSFGLDHGIAVCQPIV